MWGEGKGNFMKYEFDAGGGTVLEYPKYKPDEVFNIVCELNASSSIA